MAKSIRLWPLGLILAGLGVALLWIWFSAADSRQDRVLMTLAASTVGLLLALLWLAAFSRLGWKRRLGALATVFVAGTAVFGESDYARAIATLRNRALEARGGTLKAAR